MCVHCVCLIMYARTCVCVCMCACVLVYVYVHVCASLHVYDTGVCVTVLLVLWFTGCTLNHYTVATAACGFVLWVNRWVY